MDSLAKDMDKFAPSYVTVIEWISGFSNEESRAVWWYVHTAGHWQCGPEYRVASRTYHGHQLLFFVAGEGEGIYRGNPWRAGKGDAVLMDLRHRHSYWTRPENPWEKFFVIFDGPGVAHVFQTLCQSAGSVVIPFGSEQRMRTDLEAIFPLLRNHPPGYEAWVWHHLTGLMANIAEGLRRASGAVDLGVGAAPEGVAAALKFLQREHHRTITLQELADEAKMSLFHFTRRFRETTGFTPMEYLEKFRIRRAQELLVNQADMRLREIAEAVGYEDPAYFSRVFRRRAGVSAREYRQRMVGTVDGRVVSSTPQSG